MPTPPDHQPSSHRRLHPETKKAIVYEALSGTGISETTRKNGVCRNTVYTQKKQAQAAIDAAFIDHSESDVLFHLPISKQFIHQTVLVLVLIVKASKKLIRLMKNRKASVTTQALTLYERREKAHLAGKDYQALDEQLRQALEVMKTAETRFERSDTRCSWLQYDVLQLPACAPADREMLFDFIVEALLTMTDQPRVQTFVRSLIHQKNDLLAVAHCLNDQYLQIAQRYGLPVEQVWAIGYTIRFDIHAPTYHIHSEQLESQIGESFDQIEDDVLAALANTHRCSSIVENFNSRLKSYIDPRKTITQKTLGRYGLRSRNGKNCHRRSERH